MFGVGLKGDLGGSWIGFDGKGLGFDRGGRRKGVEG